MATAITSLCRLVFGNFSKKLNNLKQNHTKQISAYDENNQQSHESTDRVESSRSTGSSSAKMDLEILDRKIRRLVAKLKKYDINLEVFDHGDIEYGPLLGKGGEGEVHKCTIEYNDIPVEAAAKTLLDNSDDAISITLEEIELLCLAYDPIINTILRVYGISAVPDNDNPEVGHLVIIMEAGIMNALQLYQEVEVPLSVTFDLWKQLAAALHTMHCRKIIHHDLKPENILITAINRDRRGQIEKINVKVIDLGMGKRVYTEKVVTDDILGTKGYHAPEVLYEDSYDFRADVFMLGISFCVLLLPSSFLRSKNKVRSFLKSVHDAKEKKLLGKKLYDTIIAPNFEDDQNIPSSIKDMICSMVEKQSKRKISLLDVVYTCGEESERIGLNGNDRDALVELDSCTNCQDSGVISDGQDMVVTRTERRRSTAAAGRQTRSSTSTSAASSSRSTRKKKNPPKHQVSASELAHLLGDWRDQDVLCPKRTRSETTYTEQETQPRSSKRLRCVSTSVTPTEQQEPKRKRRRTERTTSSSKLDKSVEHVRTRKTRMSYSKFFTD